MLWFILALLLFGAIFEHILYRREVRHIRSELEAAHALNQPLHSENLLLRGQVNDLTDDNLVTYGKLLVAQEQAASAQRLAGDRAVTIRNLEASVETLSNELDLFAVANAKRVLGGTTMTATVVDEV